MEISEAIIDRWLERGSKFFKTTARNPVVRDALRARGLSDEELTRGWQLYTELHGFGIARRGCVRSFKSLGSARDKKK